MNIAKDKVVTIDYTLKDKEGRVIDQSTEAAPLAYLQGNGNLLPKLEEALEGKLKGDSIQVVLPPEDGYGVHEPSKVIEVPKEMFKDAGEVKPGMRFQARGPHGVDLLTVVSVEESTVKVDGNHPLADVALHFDVTVRDVREATEEELAHGHVHGPEGHGHGHDH